MRLLALSLPLVVLVMSACPPDSLIGQPCADAGNEVCEDEKLLRCDGKFFLLLADCAEQCIEKLPEVSHDKATIDADETWQCIDGPHFVPATITVSAGATLTIEAGALVRLNPASRIDTDRAGRVDALGTAEAPILFTSKTGLAAGFGAAGEGGLNVFAVESGQPSQVQHTIIERGIQGLGVFGLSSTATPPVVENNTLRDNENFGIVVSCDEPGAPIPDFAAAGNEFFGNGAGDVSTCAP